MKRIVVYVADGCPHCDALLRDLDRRQVACEVVNLTRTPEREGELTALSWQRRVPLVVDHECCSVGFRGASTPLDAVSQLSAER